MGFTRGRACATIPAAMEKFRHPDATSPRSRRSPSIELAVSGIVAALISWVLMAETFVHVLPFPLQTRLRINPSPFFFAAVLALLAVMLSGIAMLNARARGRAQPEHSYGIRVNASGMSFCTE